MRLHPKAFSVQPSFCGHCPNCHMILYDVDGSVIAEALMSVEQLEHALGMARRNREEPFVDGVFGTEELPRRQ